MKNTETKTRETGSRLDLPVCQEMLRVYVAKHGTASRCWEKICSQRSFQMWKKSNQKRWKELFDEGMNEYRVNVEMASPFILQKALKQAIAKVEAGDCSLGELTRFMEYMEGRQYAKK